MQTLQISQPMASLRTPEVVMISLNVLSFLILWTESRCSQ